MGAFMRRTAAPVAPKLPVVDVFGEYLSRRSLLESAEIDTERARFLVPYACRLPEASPVICHLRIRGEPELHVVGGKVVRAAEFVPRTGTAAVIVDAVGADRIAFARFYAHARGLPGPVGSRCEERILASFDASLRWPGGPQLQGRLVDLSPHGAHIVVPGPRPGNGTELEVRVRVGLLRRVALPGWVAWSSPGSIGVEFGDLDAAARRWILQSASAGR
jgi:hypothetical protein